LHSVRNSAPTNTTPSTTVHLVVNTRESSRPKDIDVSGLRLLNGVASALDVDGFGGFRPSSPANLAGLRIHPSFLLRYLSGAGSNTLRIGSVTGIRHGSDSSTWSIDRIGTLTGTTRGTAEQISRNIRVLPLIGTSASF